MGHKISEVMTPEPAVLSGEATCVDAAQLMRELDVGAILVEDEQGKLQGIVTDRDVVVRCIADGADPKTTTLSSLCSEAVAKLTPDDDVHEAVELMKKKAIRRVPVVDGDHAVGIVSIGDLAMMLDPDSALGRLSEAPANH